MLNRRDDWERRLVALVSERRLMPYAYGTNCCFGFAMAAVETMTDTVLLPGIRPRGWIAAAKVLIAREWADVEHMLDEVIGPSVELSLSRRGDLVSYAAHEDLHIAVRVGDSALTPSPSGLVIIPESAWRKAWKVG